MPQEALGRGLDSVAFKDLDADSREKKIREAGPEDLRSAIDLERSEVETQLDALGPHSRQELKGEAGRLNARIHGLTDIGHAIGWWENLSATGIAPRNFDQFVETAEHNLTMIPGVALPQYPNAALPGNVELVQGILAEAKSWRQSGRERKYTIEAFESRDQAVADRKAQFQAELAEINRARFSRGLEAQEQPEPLPQPAPEPERPRQKEPERRRPESQPEPRQEEARRSVERVYEREEIIDAIRDLAHGHTFIDTEVPPGGFNMTSGLGEGRESHITSRHVTPNDELKAAQQLHHVADWTWPVSETWALTPVVTRDFKTEHYTETVKTGRWGKTEVVHKTREIVDESKKPYAVKIRNPEGHDEPAVLFQYSFEEGKNNFNAKGTKGYKELSGGRVGNHLRVGFLIPASMAEGLKSVADADRRRAQELIRKLVEEVVVKNSDGRINQDMWDEGPRGYPMKPPYKDLPSTWEMDFLDGLDAVGDDPEHPAYGIDTTRTHNGQVKTFGDKSDPYKRKVFKAA